MIKNIFVVLLVLLFCSCQKEDAIQRITVSKFPGRIDDAKIIFSETQKIIAYASNDSIILKELRNNALNNIKSVLQKCQTPNCLNNILLQESNGISLLLDKRFIKKKCELDLLLPIQYSDSIYYGLKRDTETSSIICAVNNTGSILWETNVDSDDLQFIDNSDYYLYKELFIVKTLKNQLILFNALTGKYIRRFDYKGDFFDFIFNDYFVFKDEGKLLFYSINEKKSFQTILLNESNLSLINEYNNHLYVLSTMNKLYQIDQNLMIINEMNLNDKIDKDLVVSDFMIDANQMYILGYLYGKTPFSVFIIP